MGMWENALIRMSDMQIPVQTEEQHDETHSNGSWKEATLDQCLWVCIPSMILLTVELFAKQYKNA